MGKIFILLVIVIFAFLLFRPKKLPELGKAAGDTMREFKESIKEVEETEEEKKNEQ